MEITFWLEEMTDKLTHKSAKSTTSDSYSIRKEANPRDGMDCVGLRDCSR